MTCDEELQLCTDGGSLDDGDVFDSDADVGDVTDAEVDGDDGPRLPCDWRDGVYLGDVEEIAIVNTEAPEGDISLSPDGKTLYFSANRGDGPGSGDVYFAIREELSEPFGEPQLFPDVNTEADEGRLTITDNRLQLYFDSSRDGGLGSTDIWWTERMMNVHPFREFNVASSLSSPDDDREPALSPDGLTIFFAREVEPDNQDILMATRSSLTERFGEPSTVPLVHTSYSESAPSVTAFGVVLVYSSNSVVDLGGGDLWYSTLESDVYTQGRPVPGDEVNTDKFEGETAIRFDGCELFFVSNSRDGATGSSDIFRARYLGTSQ